MFERFNRIALSIALLLYLTVDPQAHAPEVFPDADHMRQGQTMTAASGHEPLNGSSSLSASRRLDFRAVVVNHPVEMKTTPFVGRRIVGLSTSSKPTRSASSGSRPFKPASKSTVRARLLGNSPRFVLAGMRDPWEVLNSGYYRLTGRTLTLTSGFRTPGQQARAIHRNLGTYGAAYVLGLYRRGPAIREVVAAYKRNRRKPQRAIRAMTTVIQTQVRRGIYVSDHMRGKAFDIRSHGRNGARLSDLRTVAKLIGGRVLIERSHYHVEF